MGLAILQKLVKSYGGDIRLTSDPEVGRGTRFDVTWPIYDEVSDTHEVMDDTATAMDD